MQKMGESQVIQFFSTVLSDQIHKNLGQQSRYVLGNFSGSQDRKFADFFAGTDSVNLLIEFKERKSEYKTEIDKPLRKRLCETLNELMANLSRSCHFIAWESPFTEMRVELNPYIDLVCTLWANINHITTPLSQFHNEFISDFINGKVGVDYESFVKYIDHLNKTAGGSAIGQLVPFRSILFSRDDSGNLKATRFENLQQLVKLRDYPPRPRGGLSL